MSHSGSEQTIIPEAQKSFNNGVPWTDWAKALSGFGYTTTLENENTGNQGDPGSYAREAINRIIKRKDMGKTNNADECLEYRL